MKKANDLLAVVRKAEAKAQLRAMERASRPIEGEIDTTYQTFQRDLFESGLVAEIGAHAFVVWSCIKSHADFGTGISWPSIRRITAQTGSASETVQKAIKKLIGAKLLRKEKNGRLVTYVARERLVVRLGDRVLCTIVIDYVPNRLREQLKRMKSSLAAGDRDPEVFAHAEILPGEGFIWDQASRSFRARVPASDFPPDEPALLGKDRAMPSRKGVSDFGTKSADDST